MTNFRYLLKFTEIYFSFVMVKFTEDTIVQPRESQWFEFYAPNQDIIILPLNQSAIYTEVSIILQTVDHTRSSSFQ